MRIQPLKSQMPIEYSPIEYLPPPFSLPSTIPTTAPRTDVQAPALSSRVGLSVGGSMYTFGSLPLVVLRAQVVPYGRDERVQLCEECDRPHDVHGGGGEDKSRAPDTISVCQFLV